VRKINGFQWVISEEELVRLKGEALQVMGIDPETAEASAVTVTALGRNPEEAYVTYTAITKVPWEMVKGALRLYEVEAPFYCACGHEEEDHLGVCEAEVRFGPMTAYCGCKEFRPMTSKEGVE
jgi:hypothetical protein